MDADPWEVVVCGVAVLTATGESRSVQMGWAADEVGQWFLASGGRRLAGEGVPPEHLAGYTRLIFGGDPGGGGEVVAPPPPAVADVVNIDGRPRPRLRDRLARRRLNPASWAAVLTAMGAAMLRFGVGSGLWCNLAAGAWTMG